MRPLRSALALSVLLLAAACGEEPSQPVGTAAPATSPAGSNADASTFPVTITDDDGVTVTIETEPQRIVTFAPSLTEIVFALGLGERLVGVSGPFDDYPSEAAEIEKVGGAGDFGVDPNVEKVVSLDPDVFLTIAGGDRWKDRLRELGVPVVTLDAVDLDDLMDDIEVAGRLTGATQEAATIVADLRAQAADVEARVAGETPVTCFYETFYPPLYTVGPETFIYDLLRRAGCDPITSSAGQPYPQWAIEDVVAQGPDVYLVSSESGTSAGGVARRPGFDAIEAVEAGRVVLIDSDLAERPGPRIVLGLRAIARALHPGAFA